jgi:hypothetical protein
VTNIALCIGCDEYEALKTLHGAENDAKRIYDFLKSTVLYGAEGTRLMLSPTLREVREVIGDHLTQDSLGIVSFYFAGHGGIKAGTFYLCLRDSNPAKLSTSALRKLQRRVLGRVGIGSVRRRERGRRSLYFCAAALHDR